ncbi:putative metal homeostasis protein [Vagococcus hydrophili]|uniref:Putative metal homeostasis protein n=1 Tax=Vagococcus hydrophili TaxID=2714947 RepID=A0A6G8ATK8_9ENTE|nr:putative metal homeostasis protein [Vagococcus hydrophili]QIL48327.1 putative metal homeostasis protein [Vagococcus hydrophili]
MEKIDISSAYRRLKSPNIKTRKRALKIIKEMKRSKTDKMYA